MAQNFDLSCFNALVNYTFANINRIKRELNLQENIDSLDFFSIAIVKINDAKDAKVVSEYLNKVLRNSDALFFENGSFVFLAMPGTDELGSNFILEDFKEFFGGKIKYKVISLQIEKVKDLGKILFELKKQLSL